MRIRGALAGLGLSVLAAAPPPAMAQSNEGGIASDIANEKAVRALFSQFVQAWNRHDHAALAEMWAIDGDHMEPDGATAKGRTAVATLFKRQHEGAFKDTHLQLSIADVWFISGDVALVDGGYAVSGIRAPDGVELPERRGHLTCVLLHEQGKWWITATRLMIPSELPYKRHD
ncbi:MAG TPA: SgcJ/EcaC family oxidoreductase [Candidatus Limnocylindria bacterium]|nr:SgcJ/EcaC family oxidoreductase [Candidatus Limnocylindria bacterium]